jgi:hypothetical protein
MNILISYQQKQYTGYTTPLPRGGADKLIETQQQKLFSGKWVFLQHRIEAPDRTQFWFHENTWDWEHSEVLIAFPDSIFGMLVIQRCDALLRWCLFCQNNLNVWPQQRSQHMARPKSWKVKIPHIVTICHWWIDKACSAVCHSRESILILLMLMDEFTLPARKKSFSMIPYRWKKNN